MAHEHDGEQSAESELIITDSSCIILQHANCSELAVQSEPIAI